MKGGNQTLCRRNKRGWHRVTEKKRWALGCGLLLAGQELKIVRPHSDCNKTNATELQYSRSASTLGSRCKSYNNLNTLPQNAKFTTIHTSFCQSDILHSTYSLRSRHTLQLTAPITTPVKLSLFSLFPEELYFRSVPFIPNLPYWCWTKVKTVIRKTNSSLSQQH